MATHGSGTSACTIQDAFDATIAKLGLTAEAFDAAIASRPDALEKLAYEAMEETVFLKTEMEMPCPCSCGQWFDLNDGFRSLHSNRVICKNCYEDELAEQEGETEGE